VHSVAIPDIGEDREKRMFDATKLLGALLEQKAAPSAGQRIDTAVQRLGDGAGQGGTPSLQAMLASLAGGAWGGKGTGLLGDLASAAQRAFGTTAQEVRSNNPVAVGGLGAAAGALLGGGRGALGGGLLALLGSLAMNAMKGGPAEGGPAAPSIPAASLPDSPEDEARLMLRAVIQASKADGTIDGEEIARIRSRLAAAGEEEEARGFVEAELRRPIDIPALAAAVRSPAQAARVYAASLLAIEVDTAAERDYLAQLATALRLPRDAVARIHDALGVPAA
jgi:uncharacterized membrane protein YebE (DUF533 family)